MITISRLPALLIAGSILAPVVAQQVAEEQPRSLEQRFQARLDELRTANGFPGASLAAVLADGKTIAVSSGFADVENEVPLTSEDRLPSGSTGKTYVLAVFLQLVDEGKVGLDDLLSKYLREEEWFLDSPTTTRSRCAAC